MAVWLVALGFNGFLVGLIVGTIVTAFFAWTLWIGVEASGARRYFVGAVGESGTGQELDDFGVAWHHLRSVDLPKRGDVDHVLVGPGGLFVIEDKFVGSPCTLSDGVVRRAAQCTETVFTMVKASCPRLAVHAVIVVRGPSQFVEPFEMPVRSGSAPNVGAVTVMAGRHLPSWRKQIEHAPCVLGAEDVIRIVGTLGAREWRRMEMTRTPG